MREGQSERARGERETHFQLALAPAALQTLTGLEGGERGRGA